MKKNFLEIDSPSDIKDLYLELCRVTETKDIDMRTIVLGFKGVPSLIRAKEISFNDIMNIVSKKKLEFSLKIAYNDHTVDEIKVPDPIYMGQREDVVASEMSAQAETLKAVFHSTGDVIQPPPQIPDVGFTR